ncbi:unnamed protein product [Caenorhabditis auriculariae]|uniref:Secreted protein n=1 Tax=Caenorhabditis auriculariae TaxID=2777116 RepID=A0A8S1GVT2_9PELO|nr:unnamed protein product [Caenorhabditis auriculariae]
MLRRLLHCLLFLVQFSFAAKCYSCATPNMQSNFLTKQRGPPNRISDPKTFDGNCNGDLWIIKDRSSEDCDGVCFKWQQVLNNSGSYSYMTFRGCYQKMYNVLDPNTFKPPNHSFCTMSNAPLACLVPHAGLSVRPGDPARAGLARALGLQYEKSLLLWAGPAIFAQGLPRARPGRAWGVAGGREVDGPALAQAWPHRDADKAMMGPPRERPSRLSASRILSSDKAERSSSAPPINRDEKRSAFHDQSRDDVVKLDP